MNRLTFALLRRFVGPKVTGFLAVGFAIGITLFAVELSFAYGLQAFLLAIGALDAQTARLPAWIPHAGLKPALAFILVVGSLRAALNASQIYLQGASHEEFRHRQRSFILRWALWSESASTAEVMTLFNARVDAAGQLAGNVQTLAIQLTSGVLLAAGLLAIAPLITLAAGAGLALIALSLLFTDRRALEAGAGMATEIDKTNARLVMSLKNLLLLQIYGTQGREEAGAQCNLYTYRRHILTSYRVQAIKYAVPQIFGVVLICLIAFASTSHGMAPGVLVSYFYMLLRLLVIFSGINQNVSTILVTWPNTRELLCWWEAVAPDRPRLASADDEKSAPAFTAPVGWRLAGVGFSYPDAKKPVFSDLNLGLQPGRTLVIVGPSGAGKSTLLGLMLGLLKPGRGHIELLADDGPHNLEEGRRRLLRSIGYVGPESFLVEGTIRENLVYGLDTVPSARELNEALNKAECAFVHALPRGLDHKLSEQGQGLSAGQKQRLSLARALLRRPKALILDEATANLDLETESRLMETLSKLKSEMTLVIVTHRSTLLPLADLKLEFSAEGKIRS